MLLVTSPWGPSFCLIRNALLVAGGHPIGPPLEDLERLEQLRPLIEALKADLAALMTDSQDWCHGLGLRRFVHSFGLVWSRPTVVVSVATSASSWNRPLAAEAEVRQWSDLIILSGNVALESMGFRTFLPGRRREEDVAVSPWRLLRWG